MRNQIPYALRSEEQKEACREATRRFRLKHPVRVEAYNKTQQANRRELYRTNEAYREKCKARSRATPPSVQREYRERLKGIVFDHYGRKCACCGETEELFLTLGHINGDGAAHRHRVNGGVRGSSRAGGMSGRMYLDIIRREFPTDIRTECINCNQGSYRNGGVCPHYRTGTFCVTAR